jgi:Xaa-Pro aminopeptidase
VKAHRHLAEAVADGVELVAAGGLVERLREVKDEGEVAAMTAAAELADSIYAYVAERGLVGRTEREVAVDLEREMRERGARDPSFPSIVAAGAHGALPHAEPRDVEIPRDTLVVLDLGCLVDGMCSDCTRTFATGQLSTVAADVYDLVLNAQLAGLDATRTGTACSDVDAAARSVIEEAGRGEQFGHGLGHGVGLEVHEGPRLTKTADGELRAGNAVTIEPGVYVPGEVGVRIEDLVIVGEDGLRNLSGFPKTLVAVD